MNFKMIKLWSSKILRIGTWCWIGYKTTKGQQRKVRFRTRDWQNKQRKVNELITLHKRITSCQFLSIKVTFSTYCKTITHFTKINIFKLTMLLLSFILLNLLSFIKINSLNLLFSNNNMIRFKINRDKYNNIKNNN